MTSFDWVWRCTPPTVVHTTSHGVLARADARTLLSSIQSEVADLVFLDPPFNLGKEYGSRGRKGDLLSEEQYSSFMHEVLTSCVHVLKPGGALYLYHLPLWALRLGGLIDGQLQFRHWIAVSMKNGFARGRMLYPAHYALLYFTKGEPAHFRRPKIEPPTCRHCGKYIRDYGGYVEHVRDGINLSDVWEDLSPVRHAAHKTRQANELPLALVERVVQISGVRDGIFVDPFVGSGTSMVAAVNAGMQYVACDRESICCEAAATRLRQHLAQLASAVSEPTDAEEVATRVQTSSCESHRP